MLNNNRLKIIISVVAIGLLAGGLSYRYIYQSRHLNDYRYNALISYRLKGSVDATGLEFKYPAQFDQDKQKQSDDGASFTHIVKKQDTTIYYASLAAANVSSGFEIGDQLYKTYGEGLLGSASSSEIAPIKDFVRSQFDDRFVITFGQPRIFTSSNIPKNAWAIDFTAKSGTTNKLKPKAYKGIGLLLGGHKGFYYFMLTSIDANWQPNAPIWQQIEDSLKTDQ